jgi:hypothetical protein
MTGDARTTADGCQDIAFANTSSACRRRSFAALEAIDGEAFRHDDGQRRRGGGGISMSIEDGRVLSAPACCFPRHRQRAAAVGDRAPAATRRTGVGGARRFARAASAQPVRADPSI